MNTKFFLHFFFKFNCFEKSDGENSTDPDYETKFTYIVQSVTFCPYREYKIKYMYLYITAKATLNTGNDHSILLFVLRMITVESQLRIAKLKSIYMKLSGTGDYRDVTVIYIYEVLLLFNGDHKRDSR